MRDAMFWLPFYGPLVITQLQHGASGNSVRAVPRAPPRPEPTVSADLYLKNLGPCAIHRGPPRWRYPPGIAPSTSRELAVPARAMSVVIKVANKGVTLIPLDTSGGCSTAPPI